MIRATDGGASSARPLRMDHHGDRSETAIYVTDKGKFVLDSNQKIKSIFGREVDYLKSQGYVFKADGTAVKVK